VASGNGKGQIFIKGEVVKTVPEDEIVETLLFEARRIAAESGLEESSEGTDGQNPVQGPPVVSVS
jgi:(E)-4-hydroxy-3-methylbut-2-enyl-diphosphate synthase